MKEKSKLWRWLVLLNPKNLAREVHVYGYHFSWKTHRVWILGAILSGELLGLMFRLKTIYFIVVAAAVCMILPVLILDMYRRMYAQKRFADAVSYMEQMLYSFQKSGKVISALKETRELFADGQMRQQIDAAIWHMELGKPRSSQGVMEEGLAMIEEGYGCVKISMVHELFLTAEIYGGKAEDAIFLLLEDIARWKKRVYRLQAEKKKHHTDNMISVIVATSLCAVTLYVLEMMLQIFLPGDGTDIFAIPAIQMSSALFILVLLWVMVKSTKSLTDDWLGGTDLNMSDYLARSYEFVVNCENQQKVGGIRYRLARKDVTEALYLALPQWMMELLLLLQQNNVQVALTKSAERAPLLLKRELELLRERMEKYPQRLQTYTAFCKSFDLPEMEECMKMLHGFSEQGTGNIRVQMKHLLERVQQMQNCADEVMDEKIAFRMRLLFSYPVLAATGKLMADLSIGMVVMIQTLGNMGGI